VTASEFAFLALGLVLGVASGAALSIVVRARPPAPREIRVTVTRDAVPRRQAATLSGLRPEAPTMTVAARGGPADPAVLAGTERERTPVRSIRPDGGPIAIPIRPEPDPLIEALDDRASGTGSTRRVAR
jgi:hypothetical protein